MIEGMRMGTVAYVTTPGGEELAILPRKELEALREAADHAQAVATYRAGAMPGLSPEETRAFVAAPSPLNFWRKYRSHTQSSLAGTVGVTQNYLSDIENGKRGGDVQLWLKLSRALQIPVEALIDEGE
jgi:DNA-binding XRE family transcriptional regulator